MGKRSEIVEKGNSMSMALSEVVSMKKVVVAMRRNTIIEAALGSPWVQIIGFLSVSRTKTSHYVRVIRISIMIATATTTTAIVLLNSQRLAICSKSFQDCIQSSSIDRDHKSFH